MTEPPQPAPTDRPFKQSGFVSRVARAGYSIPREIAWVLWQIYASFARGIVSVFSLLKQYRLGVKRRATFCRLGAEIRKAAVPVQLCALAQDCDRLDNEVQRHRDAATVAGSRWFLRASSRIQLARAQSARDAALRKLGEAAVAIGPPAHQALIASLEQAIEREQTRRVQLWEPWRALTLSRKAEIFGALGLLLLAGALSVHYLLTTNSQRGPDDNVRSQPGLAPEDATALGKNKHELASGFLKDRNEASPGDWLVYAGNPILERGELNQWDDFKAGNAIVLLEGTGFRMWYRACHFALHEYTCGIGHATSEDGLLWQKSLQPVFTPQDNHENERLDSLAIIRAASQYWMWYSVRPDRFKGYPYPTIHLATSTDGLTWVAVGPVLRALSQYTGNVEPAVYYDGKSFHMWYTDHPTDENPAILHLTSSDGKQWQTAGSMPLETTKTDPGRLSVISDGRGGFRAYFAHTGQRRNRVFGLLLSGDGNQWRLSDSEPTLSSQDVGGGGFALAPSVLAAVDGMWVWYTLRPYDGAEKIGVAFLKGAA
jgi:hypothetical protein